MYNKCLSPAFLLSFKMRLKKAANPLSILFLLFTTCSFIQAQNLVINPSFEDYDTCISTQFINYGYPNVNHWISPTAINPGYYNFCSLNPNCNPLNNNQGYQMPRTGNAFSGIALLTLRNEIGGIAHSHYIQGKLSSQLEKDSFYCVKFYLSLADFFKLSIDRIGVYFSNTQVISNIMAFPYPASIESEADVFFADSIGWMLWQKEYKANGGEQFITIGNFNSFTSTNYAFVYTTPGIHNDSTTYYYIDDVSVEMLPSYIASLDLGSDSVLCDTAGFTATLSVPQVYDSVRWNTGATTFNITISTIGTYSVTAYYGECAVKDTVTFSLFNSSIQFAPIGDTAVCRANTPILFSVANGFDTYLWSNGDTSSYTDISQPGTYFVQAGNQCFSYADTFTVTIFEMPPPPLTADTALCEGAPEPLATAVGENLQWYANTSDTSLLPNTPTIKTNTLNEQYFFVSQTINGCKSAKTTFTARINALPQMDLGSSIRACEGKFIELAATKNPAASYLWSNGDTTDAIMVSADGTFSCTVTNACGSAEDAVEIVFVDCSNCLYVPNVFSPNNDGSNDFFQVYSNCPLVSFRLKIFNRWGEKVFEATNENNRWDGYYKGILQEAGIYIYTLSLTNELGQTSNAKGSITLVR